MLDEPKEPRVKTRLLGELLLGQPELLAPTANVGCDVVEVRPCRVAGHCGTVRSPVALKQVSIAPTLKDRFIWEESRAGAAVLRRSSLPTFTLKITTAVGGRGAQNKDQSLLDAPLAHFFPHRKAVRPLLSTLAAAVLTEHWRFI